MRKYLSMSYNKTEIKGTDMNIQELVTFIADKLDIILDLDLTVKDSEPMFNEALFDAKFAIVTFAVQGTDLSEKVQESKELFKIGSDDISDEFNDALSDAIYNYQMTKTQEAELVTVLFNMLNSYSDNFDLAVLIRKQNEMTENFLREPAELLRKPIDEIFEFVDSIEDDE